MFRVVHPAWMMMTTDPALGRFVASPGRFWVGSAPRPGSSLQAAAAAYRPAADCELPGVLEVDPAGAAPPGRLYCITPPSAGDGEPPVAWNQNTAPQHLDECVLRLILAKCLPLASGS